MAYPSKLSSSQESSISEGEETNTPPLTLIQMPDEMIIHILTFSTDRKSLLAAATSCKAVHSVFEHNKMSILSTILSSRMDKSVYQEALISDRLKQEHWKFVKSGVKSIHYIYSHERHSLKMNLTSDKVGELWRFHESVEFFADRIPTTLLQNHPVTKIEDHFSLTPTVRSRFQRALYRLVSYLVIMDKIGAAKTYPGERLHHTEEGVPDWAHDLPSLNEFRVLMAFQTHYSAFEIEQISCICGLLITEIAPSFNDFLQHDIELGSRLKFYLTHPLRSGGMNLVALGLPFLHRFMTAVSHADLTEVVRPVVRKLTWGYPGREPVTFPDVDWAVEKEMIKRNPTPGQWARMKTPDSIMRTPFFDDHDEGPASAWSTMSRFCQFTSPDTDQVKLRGFQSLPWAYIFWDLKMLKESGFTNIKEEERIKSDDGLLIPDNHPVYADWKPLGKYQSNAASEYLFLSQCMKSQMVKDGLTGYFDFEAFCEENKDNLLSNLTVIPPGVLMGAIDSLPTERDLATFMQVITDFMRAGGTLPPGFEAYYGV